MSTYQVVVTKCDHVHRPVASYPGVLVYADDEQVAVRARWEEPPWCPGPLTLDTGGILIERYYPERWFNVMDLYSPVGVLLGWYCNITRPSRIGLATIEWSDLALDLLLLPDGALLELDRDEFDALPIDDLERAAAEAALATLRDWAQRRRPPFVR